MRTNGNSYLNAEHVCHTINQLFGNELFECRIIKNNKRNPLSGYFRGAENLLQALQNKVDLKNSNVYVTLQALHDDCGAKSQSNRFLENAAASCDNDVLGYQWFFIDLDPVRLSGISSSDEELKAAAELAAEVARYMHDVGFNEPLKAVSGNGCHLLYKIRLKNKRENTNLIKQCLETLALLFDNDKVKIDTVNFNPSRICKLYGTLAQKGTSTEKRPHRMSYIKNPDAVIEVNDVAFLNKLAAQHPITEQPTPARYNNYQPHEFDVENFMREHGIKYTEKQYRDGVKYVLDVCPFDGSHRAPDSAIFRMNNGAIGFKCLHNSCADKKWQDVRRLFEPEAYEKRQDEYGARVEEGLRQHNRTKQRQLQQMQNPAANGEPLFWTMAQVAELEEPESEYIRTGIAGIDNKLIGLQKTAVSVVSGLRGAAKSTMLSQIMLTAVDDKHNVVCYSGELTAKNFFRWLTLQAAGKHNVVPIEKFSDKYTVKPEALPSIISWLNERLWLYNNNYGNNFAKLAEDLQKACNEHKADLLVIDNLMALNLAEYDYDKYEAQTKFVWELKQIAKVCNVHVIFVAHPRKAIDFLRLDDIAGTSNIANIVDNAFIVHRVNADFKRKTQQTMKWPKDDERYGCSNIIEIAKDRENGTQDEFIKLWFEFKTKRLLNSKDEYVKYSWEESMTDDELPY